MYQPKHFQLTDKSKMRQIIDAHPLATLIAGHAESMQINHLPMQLAGVENTNSEVLRCHVARANPVWQLIREQPAIVAIFTGIDGYISPNWYASKARHGKVVPTWNYEAVHLHGQATVRDDKAWLRAFLNDLTDRHEREQPMPWHLHDAPDEYLDKSLNAIVGIEIQLTRWEGKAKLSQNQPAENRASVIDALGNWSTVEKGFYAQMSDRITRGEK